MNAHQFVTLLALVLFIGTAQSTDVDPERARHSLLPESPPILNAVPFQFHRYQFSTKFISTGDDPRYLATAYWNDVNRTFTLWEIDTGKALLKLPLEEGRGPSEVAVSPSGELAAIRFNGSWQIEPKVLLIRIADQQLLWKHVGDAYLAWSLDGNYVGITQCRADVKKDSRRRCLIDVRDGSVIENTVDLAFDLGHVSWGPANRLAAICGIRICLLEASEAGLKLVLPPLEMKSGVEKISMSPDGRTIAVGSPRLRSVALVSGTTLEQVALADLSGIERRVSKPIPKEQRFNRSIPLLTDPDRIAHFAWSRDSSLLRSVVRHNYTNSARSWSLDGRLAAPDIVKKPKIGKASWVGVTWEGHAIEVAGAGWSYLSPNGPVRAVLADGEIDQYREGLRVSKDGLVVTYTSEQTDGQVRTIAFSPSSGPIELPEQSLPAPIVEDSALTISTDRKSKGHLILSGHLLESVAAKLRAFAPDRRAVLAVEGSRPRERALVSMDLDGAIRWRTPVPNLTGLSISANGIWAVAACEDGTFRWYRMTDGREMLTAFLHANGKDWVVWTPDGHFEGTRRAEELLGWTSSHAKNRPEFVPIRRNRSDLHRTGLAQGVLGGIEP